MEAPGVMNAVHAGRHQHEDQHALDRKRKPQVAVLEQRVELKDRLVCDEHPRSAADERHLQRAESGRETDLDEVEAHRRAHVEIVVDVMSIVEPPEKRPRVIRPMPVVKREVHHQEGDDRLDAAACRHDAREAPLSFRYEFQDRRRHRSHHGKRDGDRQ